MPLTTTSLEIDTGTKGHLQILAATHRGRHAND
jgi:hypothetical protein